MAKNKHRWAKLRNAVVPKRFHYVGLRDGRTLVYRGNAPFDWGPLENVDREALRRLLGHLNGLSGQAIERIGRPACEKWKREFDAGKYRVADPTTPEAASSTAGPAETGNAKETEHVI